MIYLCTMSVQTGHSDRNQPSERLEVLSARMFNSAIQPAYRHWMNGPGEMLGFWMGIHDADEMRARTRANSASIHYALHLEVDSSGGNALKINAADLTDTRDFVRMHFSVDRSIDILSVLVSTAFDGSAGRARLLRIDKDRGEVLISEATQGNSLTNGWLVVKPESPAPPGEYILEVRAARGRVEVWPGEARNRGYSVEDPAGKGRSSNTALDGWIQFNDRTWEYWRKDSVPRSYLSISQGGIVGLLGEAKLLCGIGIGEHNNPFFIQYPEEFHRQHPESRMLNPEGDPVRLRYNPILKRTNYYTRMDDPTVAGFSAELVRKGVRALRNSPWVRYWVITGEECYPEYFGLSPGDFRPASWRHFEEYLGSRGWDIHAEKDTILSDPPGPSHAAWYLFWEKALADRAANAMQVFLGEDPSRPVFYPTHGNPFCAHQRRNMGQPTSLLAGRADGFETGQILIDDDAASLNLLTLAHYSSYGLPFVTPRLANKQLDPAAMGGGRSFSPEMLRRTVYECLGMEAWNIGMVQWTGDLADGEWHIKETPAEREARRVFSEIESASPVLQGMSRVQPRAGFFISDSTWLLDGWNPRWTGLFQDAFAAHWQVGWVGDLLFSEELAEAMPAIISIDNAGILEYLRGGGTLFIGGDFSLRDELRNARARSPFDSPEIADRIVRVSLPDEGGERELVNRFSTDRGAFDMRYTYRPVSLQAIEREVWKHFPPEVLGPLTIVESDPGLDLQLHCLTDGTSLFAVVINQSTTAGQARIAFRDMAIADKCRWQFRCLTRERKGDEDSCESGRFTIGSSDSQLVWIHPTTSEVEVLHAMDRARRSVEAWKALGCDLSPAANLLVTARNNISAGQLPKAFSLANTIESWLGLKAKAEQQADGSLAGEVQLHDSRGEPVTGARVRARIVPGDFRLFALAENELGVYRASIPSSETIDSYDLDEQRYRPLTGPVRLVLNATANGLEGGALVNLHLQEAKSE